MVVKKILSGAKGSITSLTDNIDALMRIGVALLLAIGVYLVIAPFLTSLLIAIILVITTWPLYERLHQASRGYDTPPALIMVSAIVFLVVIPISWGLIRLAQVTPQVIHWVKDWVKGGFPLPHFVEELPYLGSWLSEAWIHKIEPSSLAANLGKLVEPISGGLLNLAINVTSLIVQLAIITFLLFFLYRDGIWFANKGRIIMDRVSGQLSGELTNILVNTTRSVILGLLGNAVLQGLVAYIGFVIAGVPGAIILGLIVMVASIIPVGPPLVWGPAALWLYAQGEAGYAVFLVLWGLLAVSSVDNFVKPMLMKRGTTMPFWLIFLGVFGGVIAFGVLGLILGPLLLALAQATLRAWIEKQTFDASADLEDLPSEPDAH